MSLALPSAIVTKIEFKLRADPLQLTIMTLPGPESHFGMLLALLSLPLGHLGRKENAQ
jgi:hypothetical protein